MKNFLIVLMAMISTTTFAGFRCVDVNNDIVLEADKSKRVVTVTNLQTSQVIRQLQGVTIHISDNLIIWPRPNNHGGSAIVFNAKLIYPLNNTYEGFGLGLEEAICETF
jgi:hypothetical protein